MAAHRSTLSNRATAPAALDLNEQQQQQHPCIDLLPSGTATEPIWIPTKRAVAAAASGKVSPVSSPSSSPDTPLSVSIANRTDDSAAIPASRSWSDDIDRVCRVDCGCDCHAGDLATEAACRTCTADPTGNDPNWLALPDDVLYTVFEWLPIATLVRASEVCRSWRGVARDHGLWARLYSSEFGLGGVRFTRASCVCEQAGGNGSESSSSLSTSFEAATPSCLIHPHAGSPPRSDAAPLLYPRRVPAEAWQFEYFGRRKLELDVSPRQATLSFLCGSVSAAYADVTTFRVDYFDEPEVLAVESGAAYTPCIICEPYYVYGGRLICYDASVFHDYLLAPQDLSHSYSETFLRTLSFFLNRTEDTRDREDPDRAAHRDMRLFRISKGDVKTYVHNRRLRKALSGFHSAGAMYLAGMLARVPVGAESTEDASFAEQGRDDDGRTLPLFSVVAIDAHRMVVATLVDTPDTFVTNHLS